MIGDDCWIDAKGTKDTKNIEASALRRKVFSVVQVFACGTLCDIRAFLARFKVTYSSEGDFF